MGYSTHLAINSILDCLLSVVSGNFKLVFVRYDPMNDSKAWKNWKKKTSKFGMFYKYKVVSKFNQ